MGAAHRRRTLLSAAMACLVGAGTAAAQAPPSRYALLIGIGEYERTFTVPPLDFPDDDVDALAAVLTGKLGYRKENVVVLKNQEATRGRIIAALNRLAYKTSPQDDFLLFFAGHGARSRFSEATVYWLTEDSDLEFMDVAGIRLRHLLDYVADIPAARKLVLLDHCYSGRVQITPPSPAADDAPGRPRDVPGLAGLTRGAVPISDMREQLSAKGVVVLGAARAEAYELRTLGHGLFTAAVLNAFENTSNADGNRDLKLSLHELQLFLPQEMKRLAPTVVQEMLDTTVAADASRWWVVESLPVPAATDAAAKKDEYAAKLTTWESKGWITRDTRMRCLQVLLSWVAAKTNGQQLAAEDDALVDQVRIAMESSAYNEETRAEALKQYVRNLPPLR